MADEMGLGKQIYHGIWLKALPDTSLLHRQNIAVHRLDVDTAQTVSLGRQRHNREVYHRLPE